ncbi:MAG: ATP-dependent protease ATPase subunit HslU [Planctomycetes bacterium]|jgi:ATP-dependent HslUV protease ATP-binding subunit HslU|nr:ATP-dependent protease ATPase subunit HslU [Planctomycetota bacterium]
MTDFGRDLTPTEITRRLDEYIVGQQKAKRAVAVALRNRWRRRQLGAELAADVYPKNILLIGPTGVGKTEIARRLASLARAPFIKVEATKYSEVGYHGRDVESMVRDLVDASVALVRAEKVKEVEAKAAAAAEARIWNVLADELGLAEYQDHQRGMTGSMEDGIWRARPASAGAPPLSPEQLAEREQARILLRQDLTERKLETRPLDIEVRDSRTPTLSVMGPQGNETMGIDTQALQELWGRSPGNKTKVRKLTIGEARKILHEEEADKLLDQDAIAAEALDRAQNDGIIFVDEIDKIVSSGGSDGPDVSREGVQRDLLSVVEGCAVYTRYGHIRTDHVLFLAAGAFHFHKPSELIPELQGRFPVRVALQSLTEADFVRILAEPKNALTRQYVALFRTENVDLSFTKGGLERLAALAFRANRTTQDIGARRLMTILEKCLEDLSFDASERSGQKIVIDEKLVNDRLGETGDDSDLIPYRL